MDDNNGKRWNTLKHTINEAMQIILIKHNDKEDDFNN